MSNSNEFIWLSEPLHKNHFKHNVFRVKDDKVQKAKFFELGSVDYLQYSFDGSIIAFDKKIMDDNSDLKKRIDMTKMGYGSVDLPKYVKTEEDLIKILLYYADEE